MIVVRIKAPKNLEIGRGDSLPDKC